MTQSMEAVWQLNAAPRSKQKGWQCKDQRKWRSRKESMVLHSSQSATPAYLGSISRHSAAEHLASISSRAKMRFSSQLTRSKKGTKKKTRKVLHKSIWLMTSGKFTNSKAFVVSGKPENVGKSDRAIGSMSQRLAKSKLREARYQDPPPTRPELQPKCGMMQNALHTDWTRPLLV